MMFYTTLLISALASLTHTKAIVTNQCPGTIYIWSIPAGPSTPTNNSTIITTSNLPVCSSGTYSEAWRQGTSVNPGIAIKISPDNNGIYEDKTEIDFQYTVDGNDGERVWINVHRVRGDGFDAGIELKSCGETFEGSEVGTVLCKKEDDVELVLCSNFGKGTA